MRHLGQVDHHRLAADVLAQRERQRRFQLIVLVRAQDLRQVHDLLVGVGDLQPNHVLAGDHIDHAHADHRQAARDVLVQTRHLRTADARRRLHLETGDHRARIGANHLGLDLEILQFELDLARKHLEGFLGITRPLRRRFVQQRQRRQLPRCGGADEQRNLRFQFRPLALGYRRRGGLDAHRFALGLLHRIGLLDHFAFGACLPRGQRLWRLAQLATDPGQQLQHALAGPVHHLEPRQPGSQRHRDQEQRQQQQRRALVAERTEQGVADPHADDAADALRQHRIVMEIEV